MLSENMKHYSPGLLALMEKDVWDILSTVTDPEVPVLTIIDLGIVRDVKVFAGKETAAPTVEIFITPTYTGCPAMDMISMNIRLALLEHDMKNVSITTILSPAWTTDWMSEAGKEKLKEYGIAPPRYMRVNDSQTSNELFAEENNIECPLCHSQHTKLLSQFGSTACKALYQCADCKEPFDYFKCH